MRFTWGLMALLFYVLAKDAYLALAIGFMAGFLLDVGLWWLLVVIERLGALYEGRPWSRQAWIGPPTWSPCPGCRRRQQRIADLHREAAVTGLPVQRQPVDDDQEVAA